MVWDALMHIWRQEYYGELDALRQAARGGVNSVWAAQQLDNFPKFYDWLILRHKATRYQLSAHGVRKDVS